MQEAAHAKYIDAGTIKEITRVKGEIKAEEEI
jgi:hypothetical protein